MEQGYNPQMLESFPNRNPQRNAWISFICTEFTSLCPKTGWPDFARIFVNYIAAEKMLESKSMKLYLGSFRNHGDFHEDCIERVLGDLVELLGPRYLEVIGEFHIRGGIGIWPYYNYDNGEEYYRKLKEHRQREYSPGKYTCGVYKGES